MIDQIKKKIKDRILCIYYGGSIAYGFESEKSDIDLMVITDSTFHGLDSVSFEIDGKQVDVFKTSKEYFREIQNIEEDTNSFATIHADNILCCKDERNILYIDDEYKDDFFEIVNNSWTKEKISKFLKRFVDFFGLTLGLKTNYKRHYHVYRMKAMIDAYDETRIFSLDLKEPFKTRAIDFKNKYMSLPNANAEVSLLLKEIEDYIRKINGK